MANIPNEFSKFESPFKVLEDLDLNYQTPTSSMRVQKKSLFNSGSSDKREKKVAFWREKFVINKHPLQITTLGLKTPPMDISTLLQPLAPMKPRKTINKMDLKPKKLIFKDIEESEVNIIKYPSTFTVKHDDNILNEQNNKLKINRRKPTASDEKENQREPLTYRIKRKEKNNGKINLLKAEGNSNNNYNSNSSCALSLTQSKNSRIKSSHKHFRI